MSFTAKDMRGRVDQSQSVHVYPQNTEPEAFNEGRRPNAPKAILEKNKAGPQINEKVAKKIKQVRSKQARQLKRVSTKKALKTEVMKDVTKIEKRLKTKAPKVMAKIKRAEAKMKKAGKQKPQLKLSKTELATMKKKLPGAVKFVEAAAKHLRHVVPKGFETLEGYQSGGALVFKHKKQDEIRVIPKNKNPSTDELEKVVHDVKKMKGFGAHKFSVHIDKPCKGVLPGMARSLVDTYDKVHFTNSPLTTAKLREIIKRTDDNTDDTRKAQLAKNVSATFKAGIPAKNKKRKRGETDADKALVGGSEETHSKEVPDIKSNEKDQLHSYERMDHNPNYVTHEFGYRYPNGTEGQLVWYAPLKNFQNDAMNLDKSLHPAHANQFLGNVASHGIPGHLSHALNTHAMQNLEGAGWWHKFKHKVSHGFHEAAHEISKDAHKVAHGADKVWHVVRKPAAEIAGQLVGQTLAGLGCAVTGLETGGMGCVGAEFVGSQAGSAVADAILKKATHHHHG